MTNAKKFMTLWVGEFPGEDPPGMKWDEEKTLLTLTCDKPTGKPMDQC